VRAASHRRADHHPELCVDRLRGQLLRRGLGHAEVDDLRHRLVVADRHQNVSGLQVAVDHRFLVRVLHPRADLQEQLQTLAVGQPVPVAVLGDRDTLDVLHHEVRPAVRRRARVEDLGDRRVVHQRQRLPLGLEAGHDLFRVHPLLDHLERDLAAHRSRWPPRV